MQYVSRRLSARSPLERARLLVFLVTTAAVLVQVGRLTHPASGRAVSGPSVAAVVLLLAVLATTWSRARLFPLEPIVTPALVVVLGAGLSSPAHVVMVSIATSANQALYGGIRSWGSPSTTSESAISRSRPSGTCPSPS
jgi:hypothetical protein